MKSKVIALLIAIVGMIFALYFGFYVMFISSIMTIINSWSVITSGLLAWSIVKIFFAGLVGSLIFWGSNFLGALIWHSAE